jgi:hypothetical protein
MRTSRDHSHQGPFDLIRIRHGEFVYDHITVEVLWDHQIGCNNEYSGVSIAKGTVEILQFSRDEGIGL